MSADHLAPVEDPKARRRCKCEFSGGGVWAKQCEFHRRLLGVKEALPSETGPIVAHSKTEYKRLKEQGANVLPPSATGATSDIVNRILDNVRKARLVDENFTEHLDLISCGVGLLAASSPPVEVGATDLAIALSEVLDFVDFVGSTEDEGVANARDTLEKWRSPMKKEQS